MIDSGVDLDLEAVVQNIAEADIVGLYFPTLRKTLLLDTRCTDCVPALITVTPMERDLSARLHSIRRLRPQLPRPESITMIPWDRRVDSLVRLGVWEYVLARVPDPACAERCLEELRCLERSELRDAITGHEYESLWTRCEE